MAGKPASQEQADLNNRVVEELRSRAGVPATLRSLSEALGCTKVQLDLALKWAKRAQHADYVRPFAETDAKAGWVFKEPKKAD